MADLPRPVLFGAAYYHEYQPTPRLEQDLDLMVEAGFSVIRVGESVWSTWEPEDGRFDLDWLQPVLDGAHALGISVILGTPTYAAPPWLARKYPEVAGEFATGRRTAWGGRQEIEELLVQRTPIYRACATLEVDTEGKGPGEIADEILAALGPGQ